ncbi:MAG: DUF4384 domain-containing protein [Planctomycetota bacterium]
MKRLWIAGLIFVAMAAGRATEGAVEEAASRHTPWSGYWWPIGKGEILGPLAKYDQLTGQGAAAWEHQTHPPGPDVPEWFGYCHAWASASVLEFEPKEPRQVPGPPGSPPITLGVGDQKALFAASHALDVANHYGERFGDGQGPEDFYDMAPDTLWQLLRMHIKEQRLPIIMDLEAGPEVWNYPVFAYRVEYAPSGPGGLQTAQLSLWAADDAVPPDHVGVEIHFQTYTFTFLLRNGSIVMGSGRWIGQSLQNHPDFAWYPYVAMPENPHVEYGAVKQINGSTGSGPGSGTLPSDGEQGAGVLSSNDTFLSPLQLVATIAEKTSRFALDVTVDRFDGGQYAVGDPLVVRGTSEQPGHLYLFYIDSQGNLALLYPKPGQDNRIAAQQPFVVPKREEGGPSVPIRLAGPFGVHRIKAVVTSRPLVLTGLVPPGGLQQQTIPGGPQQQTIPGRPQQQTIPGGPQQQTTPGGPQQQTSPGYQMSQFRWYPSQRQQVKALLLEYQEEKSLPSKDLDGISVPELLNMFAQDEVTFYVGPREN